MAALVVDPGFDPASLRAHLARRLPDYARPVFVRLIEDLQLTETFKPKKQALAAEGWDPARTTDPLFVDDRAAGVYLPLDSAMDERLRMGDARL